MHVKLEIESLRCTSGGSDKSYTLIAVEIDSIKTALIKVHGPTKAPQQCVVGEYREDEWHRTLASKLKKYNRVKAKTTHVWMGDVHRWQNEGALLLRDCILKHGIWQGVSTVFDDKLESAAHFAVTGMMSDEIDPAPEELFRTPAQREKAKQEKQEAQRLEHWGSF